MEKKRQIEFHAKNVVPPGPFQTSRTSDSVLLKRGCPRVCSFLNDVDSRDIVKYTEEQTIQSVSELKDSIGHALSMTAENAVLEAVDSRHCFILVSVNKTADKCWTVGMTKDGLKYELKDLRAIDVKKL